MSFLTQDHIDGFLKSKSIDLFGFYFYCIKMGKHEHMIYIWAYDYFIHVVTYLWPHILFITVPWIFKSDMFSLMFVSAQACFILFIFLFLQELFSHHLTIFIKCVFAKKSHYDCQIFGLFYFLGWATWSYCYLKVIVYNSGSPTGST